MFSSIKSRRNFITQIDKREARGTIFPKAILIITEYIQVIEIIYDTVVNYLTPSDESCNQVSVIPTAENFISRVDRRVDNSSTLF